MRAALASAKVGIPKLTKLKSPRDLVDNKKWKVSSISLLNSRTNDKFYKVIEALDDDDYAVLSVVKPKVQLHVGIKSDLKSAFCEKMRVREFMKGDDSAFHSNMAKFVATNCDHLFVAIRVKDGYSYSYDKFAPLSFIERALHVGKILPEELKE